jgi:hypothetical protein
MVTLTRLLYSYDEVMLNLMFSILERKDFREVIFWTAELYHSGFLRELSDFTWTIYYDFYALYSNVAFYKLNVKLASFKKTSEITDILNCFNILFQSKPYCEVFIITRMMKLQKVRAIRNYKNVFKIIESALKNKKTYYIINYLNASLIQDENNTIKYYNEFIQKINKKNITLFKKKSKNVFSELINHLFKNTNLNTIKFKKKRMKYEPISISSLKYYESLVSINIQSNTLQEKRHYGLHDFTGIFKLKRQQLKIPMSDIFWYHWEYYSKETPFWREKYEKFNVSWDNEKIVFTNDDKLEEFYEKYNYELDELPHDISHKSIKSFEDNLTILDFLYKYFKTINLPLQKNKIDIKNKIQY